MSEQQTELLKLLDRPGARLYALLTRLILRKDVAEESGRDWNGLIDDVRIYNYALSEAEVQTLIEKQEPSR